jgi:spore coat-associated protein N
VSVNMQNKKKIAIGVAAVAAAAITLSAGTFAFFSSTGTATDTTATAGTLEIGQSETELMNLPTFTPGGTPVTRTLTFLNKGSLDGNLSLKFTVAGTEDGCRGDEPTYDSSCGTPGPGGQLANKLHVKISDDHGDTAYEGSVSSLNSHSFSTPNVAHGTPVTYTLEFTFPNGNASDNAAQGDTATVSTTATLAQS